MKRGGGILFVCFLFCIHTIYAAYLPIAYNGKWGLIDKQGKIILKPIYDHIEYNDLSKKYIFNQNGKYGVLNADGKVLFQPQFDQIFFPDIEWSAFVIENELKLYFQLEEKLKLKADSVFKIDDIIFGLVDEQGTRLYFKDLNFLDSIYYPEIIIEDIYTIASINELELFDLYIKNNSKCRFNSVVEVEKINETHLLFKDLDGNKYLYSIDRDEKYKIPSKFSVLSVFGKIAIVNQDNFQGLYDLDEQKIILNIEYDYIELISPYYLGIKNGKYGLINNRGNEILPTIYDNINIYNAIIVVEENEKYGLFSSSGRKICNTIYDKIKVYDNKIKSYNTKTLDIYTIKNNIEIEKTSSFSNYLTIDMVNELPARPKFTTLNFRESDFVNNQTLDFEEYEKFGWLRRIIEIEKEDTIITRYGNWGLKYNDDSMAIRHIFPQIEVIRNTDYTCGFPKKRYTNYFENNINRLKSNESVVVKMYGEDMIIFFSFFKLVNHVQKKVLSNNIFLNIHFNDFENYALARAYVNSPVLINKNGEIVYDNLTYYGKYNEDLLVICEGGTIKSSKNKKNTSPMNKRAYFYNFLNIAKNNSSSGFFNIENGNWFLIDKNGKKVNNEPYQYINQIDSNRSIVMKNDLWGVIDSNLNEIVPIQHNEINKLNRNNNIFYVANNRSNKKFIYDKKNVQVTLCPYDDLKHYHNGKYFALHSEKKMWGLIDTNLNPITDFKYINAFAFNDGYATVLIKGRKSVIDEKGNEVLSNHRAKLINYIGYDRFELVINSGSIIINKQHDTLLTAKECVKILASNERYIIYNKNKQDIAIYDELNNTKLPKNTKIISYSLENNLLLLKNDKKQFLFDLVTGKTIKKQINNAVELTEFGYVFKDENKLVGLISYTGDTIINGTYFNITSLKNKLAFAENKKNNFQLINQYGQTLNDQTYNRYIKKNNVYYVYNKGLVGILSEFGETIIPCTYIKIELYNDIFYKTWLKNGKCELFDLTGKKIVPALFEDVKGVSENSLVVSQGSSQIKWDYYYSNYLNKTLYFQEITPISSNLFILNEKEKTGVYDYKGKNIIPVNYHSVILKEDDIFQVRHFNSFGYFDTNGNIIFDPLTE